MRKGRRHKKESESKAQKMSIKITRTIFSSNGTSSAVIVKCERKESRNMKEEARKKEREREG
jgi:hypothetical protein